MEEEEAVAAATLAEAAAAGTRVEGARNMPALKVVAAVDASEESLHALSWALDSILRGHPDAALVVVHAQNFVDHFVYPVAGHGIGTGDLDRPAHILLLRHCRAGVLRLFHHLYACAE
jgi:hypothetical protein